MKNRLLLIFLTVLNLSGMAQKKPNIVIITVDDVGYFDLSCYHKGLASYKTPNIDRIAKEGRMITDYYAQPSCTPGRAALITGQYPIRTGLTSVGQPGQKIGLHKEDPTLAELLKPHGYKTALFGKWHMGDRNEYLPTNHGFDEFFGLMYHLNLMEMPEQAEFPKNPNYPGRPRNMVHSWATNTDDTSEDPRWGLVGKQKIEDAGQLTRKRMEEIDEEFLAHSEEWLEANKEEPFFLWFNPSRMHQATHVGDKWRGQSGMSEYADGLIQLDWIVGQLLDKIKAIGQEENTIVMFSSDNGVNMSHWPDAGTGAFRGEKGTTWDGGFRVPMLVKWPAKIPPNTYTGEFMTSEDWVPTIMAALGEDNLKSELMAGKNGYKVHLDGYNQLAMLTSEAPSERHEFFYYAETEMTAFRVNQWKVHTAVKDEWLKAPEKLDGGLLVNIKLDPFEKSPESKGHFLWMKEKSWILPVFVPHLRYHQKSLAQFPPRQSGAGIGAATILGGKKKN
ncbi:MAG: arylsulfatase A-like enzyme [Arcticibacterium sp.]|jgi:arylsulfatase A-like enzyme